MNAKALRSTFCAIASVALLAVPALTQSASARPRFHVVHCKPGSTVQHPCMGTRGNDKIIGTHGNDVIQTNGGHDQVITKGGDDQVNCDDGEDRIDDNNGGTVAMSNCENAIQEYEGTVTAIGGSSISVQYTDVNDPAQAFLDANGDPNPVTANITPDTKFEDGGAPAVGDTVKLEAVVNATDATQIDALKVETEDGSGED